LGAGGKTRGRRHTGGISSAEQRSHRRPRPAQTRKRLAARGSGCLAGLLLLLCLWPAAARAGDFDRHKEAGFSAFELGHYSKAIVSFSRAYVIKRDPRLLYNLGLAYLKRFELKSASDDLRKARDMFSHFLELVSPNAYPGDEARIKKVQVLARTYLRSIERRLKLLPDPRPPPDDGPTEPVVAPQDRRGPTVHWLLYSSAVTFSVAAAITGGLALNASSEAEDLADVHEGELNHDAADRADRLAITTDVLVGIAAASLVAAVVVQLWPDHRSATLRSGRSGLVLGFDF
jgi:tetratricopeptide (TPR) repeat protein